MVFVKQRKWRRLLIRQRDLSDCGPACIASVSRYHYKHVTVAKIRQLANTTQNGTTLLGLVEAAAKLGFIARGVKAASAEDLPTPSIVHVILHGKISHYVVLVRSMKNLVTIMDPADGKVKRLDRVSFNNIWTGIAVLMDPGENFSKTGNESTLKKIANLVMPLAGSLAWATVCAILLSVLGVTISLYVKHIVDVIIVSKQIKVLNVVSAITIIVLAIQGVVTIFKGRIVLLTGKKINADLIMTYYRHLFALPQTFIDSMRVGEMLSRINDAVKITAFIHEFAVNLVVDLLIVVICAGAMFYFNWRIGLLIISFVPVYSLLYYFSNRINKRWQKAIAMSGADLDASLVENLSAAATIKHLGIESYSSNKIFGLLETLLKNVYDASVKQLNIQAAAELLSKIAAVALLWAGSVYVMENKMTTGELMLFYTLLIWFTAPVIYLLGANKIYNEAVTSAERLFEILDLDPDEKGSKRINKDDLKIEFTDVWFAYGYSDYILKGINLTIDKGTIVGISGKSGCGKSTLASLLLRDHKPSMGLITISGVNISEIDNSFIHEMVSIVSQKTDLFSVTIRENITIGKPYNEEWLNVICEKLGILAFTSCHAAGLDTMLSEQGSNLSGGQKQRIAIARAIYRNTPLLILDEATTAIDSVSEEIIMQTIEWYKNSGNTVIIIAHSESTLKICNNIVILEDGVIK